MVSSTTAAKSMKSMESLIARHISRCLLLYPWVLALGLALLPAPALAQDQPAHSQESTSVAGPSSDAEGLWSEPRIIARGIDFATRLIGDGGDVKSGLYPELSHMPTGAGWISGGPGYRHWLFGDEALVDASAAISWRAYKMAQARFELPQLAHSRLAVGSQVHWQDLTQVTFFGTGADAPESDRSEYRFTSTSVVGYATVRPTQWFSIGGRTGWLSRPSINVPAGSFRRGHPATQDVFPEDPVFALPEQPNYAYGEAFAAVDTRDHRSHPTRGGVYRAAWTKYADRDAGTFSFRRSEVEAAHFVPLAASRVVLAMHGWLVASATADGTFVPFYLQPSLGGHNTLRGYTDFRFHDRNLVVVNLESRIAVFAHVDAALFADAGNVAPRMSGLNLDRRSYGFGFRMHSYESTFARVDMARGSEGWQFLFRLNDPLHLSRHLRHMAIVPFVP
jgi:hypothetical protein